MGDFNGDGKMDIATWINGSQVMIHISRGDSFTTQTWPCSLDLSISDTTLTPLFWFGDVDGDGLTDIIAWHPGTSNEVEVHYATRDSGAFTGFTRITYPCNLGTGDNTNPWVWLGDFNGDGITDLAGVRYAVNNGQATWPLTINLFTGTGFTVSDPQYISYAAGTPFLVADFTGDGKTDVIGVDRISCEEGSCYNGITDLSALYASSPSPHHLLARVENGIGGTTTITYTPSSSYLNTTLPFVVQTVGSITIDDGNGITSTTEYSFARGLYNHADREFYGFGYAIGRGPSGALTETFFKQREATGIPNRYKGLVSAQMVSGAGVEGPAYTYTKNFYAVGPEQDPVFPRLYTRDDHLCDGSDACRRMRTNLFHDAWGNVTDTETMECFGALAAIDDSIPSQCTSIADYRHEQTSYAANKTAWVLNRPVVSRIMDGTAVKAETRFAYDGAPMGSTSVTKGNLTAKEDWNDQGVSPLTTYAYNI